MESLHLESQFCLEARASLVCCESSTTRAACTNSYYPFLFSYVVHSLPSLFMPSLHVTLVSCPNCGSGNFLEAEFRKDAVLWNLLGSDWGSEKFFPVYSKSHSRFSAILPEQASLYTYSHPSATIWDCLSFPCLAWIPWMSPCPPPYPHEQDFCICSLKQQIQALVRSVLFPVTQEVSSQHLTLWRQAYPGWSMLITTEINLYQSLSGVNWYGSWENIVFHRAEDILLRVENMCSQYFYFYPVVP